MVTMNLQVQWLTPSPLWNELSTAADTTPYRRPAILRFATDTFMTELQTVMQQTPQNLRNYVAQGETWTNPTAGLGATSTLPLKLFQPVQSRFYMIAASLVCRKPGLPDHTINKTQGENVTFVVRQLRPKPGFSPSDGAVYDPTKCNEYAWILPATPGAQAGWTQVPQTSPIPQISNPSLMPGEEQIPLAPAQAANNGSTRRIFMGLIPASRRQQYTSAQTLNGNSSGNGSNGSGNGSGTPQDPRADMFNREVVTPWCLMNDWWSGLASSDQSGGNGTSADFSSALILADFATFLSDWIPNVWAAINDSSKISALSQAELNLYNGFGTGLRQAIQNANTFDSQIEAEGSSVTLPAGYAAYNLATSHIDPTALQTLVSAALPALSTVSEPPAPQPVPQKPADPEGNYWFIIRCVYVRPGCTANVISAPSQPFQLACYFDSDAPARRIQVALPLDTSAASFPKYDKGISFLLPPQLRNQMSRVTSLQNLANGQLGSPGGIGIGWICSFSIPIITICAMILLFVIVIALNLVFFWIPFFKICLPVPTLKGKT